MQMVSFRSPVFLSVLLLSVLSTVPATRGADEDAQKKKDRENYELMALFVETFQQVESNYVRDVDRRELMEAAIQGMLHHLDQHSSFIPPTDVRRFTQMVEQEFGGIGITVNLRGGRLLVVSPLPGTPAYRAGVRAGDVIVKIEGKSTDGITLNGAVKKLQGPIGRPVELTVAHSGGKVEDLTIVRQLIKAPTVRGDRYDESANWVFTLQDQADIGYIRLSNFSRYTSDEVKAAVAGLVKNDVQGLVIDLRFNPGGLLDSAIEIADMFLSEGNIVSIRGRNVPEKAWKAHKSGTFPDFPVAILVNRYSASASEVLSACLQDNKRAIVVGERTYGKGSVQNVIRMEAGDSALKLTTASYHRPSGVNIHRFPDMNESAEWGVTPDDGYVMKYSALEWRQWDQQRSVRDVLRQKDTAVEPPDDSPAEESFKDRQLLAAVEYIRESSTPGSTEEATEKAVPDDSGEDVKEEAKEEAKEK